MVSAIDHRIWKTGLPVRSAVLKPYAGQLVLKWVTIWESWLLIVFAFFTEDQGIFLVVVRTVKVEELLFETSKTYSLVDMPPK